MAILKEVNVDESKHVFKQTPEIIVLDDSISLLYTNDDSKYFLTDYNTGAITTILDIKKLISPEQIAQHFFKTDTTSDVYKDAQKAQKEMGVSDIKICQVSRVSGSRIFITFTVSIPRITVNKADTSLTFDLGFFSFECNPNLSQPGDVRPLELGDIDFEGDHPSPYPSFGQYVHNGKIYFANIATQRYKGKMISVYNYRTLAPDPVSPEIYNLNPGDTGAMNNLAFLHFVERNGIFFTDNRWKIYDVNQSKEVLDLKKYVSDIHHIMYYAPLDTMNKVWFVYYKTNRLNDTTRLYLSRTAIINTEKNAAESDRQVSEASFCTYKNNLISIQQKNEKYVFITYKIS